MKVSYFQVFTGCYRFFRFAISSAKMLLNKQNDAYKNSHRVSQNLNLSQTVSQRSSKPFRLDFLKAKNTLS